MSDQVNKNKGISNEEHSIPEYGKSAFHCPHCNTYANQKRQLICINKFLDVKREIEISIKESYLRRTLDKTTIHNITKAYHDVLYDRATIKNSCLSSCDHCRKFSIWIDKQVVYPQVLAGPLPVSEMPDSVKELYDEARAIYNQSPRGACALLRLSIQTLVKKLGEDENNLNKAIGNLVERGLPQRIQQALDSVRVIGNSAVHPGKINIQDSPKKATALFMLVNFICEKMITENKRVKAIFDTLPGTSKKAIQKRDSTVNEIKIKRV